MSHCPSCGRYVGPYEACPYCGARLSGRIPVRAVKIAAILLAMVGLAALWFVAARAETPLVPIGQASATMNMAYVRLAGRCTRTPTYDPTGEYLSFWIDDSTGEMRVSAYRAETRAIIEQGRAPALGDWVEVAGTLRVREDFLALTVNVPEQLIVTRAEPLGREIGAIAPSDVYLRVRVEGEVREVYSPYEGLTLITVRDATGEIPIAVSEDITALSGPLPDLVAGQVVAVTATVSLYGDTPQLVPASVADIVPLDRSISVAIETTIGALTAEDVEQIVVITGTVTMAEAFSSGTKYTLDDGSGQITLLLWQNIRDALPRADTLDVGAIVRAQGAVAEYEGALEIVPELAADVEIVAAAPRPEQLSIGDLTSASVGQTVALRGTLGDVETFSSGVRFPLNDGTGVITLLLWDNVYAAIPDAGALVAGTEVKVTGRIEEYQGELEIVPEADGVEIGD